jgi:MFS family permease
MVLGLTVQALGIVPFVVSGTGPGVAWVVLGLLVNGLGAGLALPAMHRAAMGEPGEKRGAAVAGLYSMVRFWGRLLGTAAAGVLLQGLLDRGLALASSYRLSYAVAMLVGLLGLIIAIALRRDRS